jgi:trimeric autotransporter adhesin
MKRLKVNFNACILLLVAMAFTPALRAQIHVDADGEVGIGTTSPTGMLYILNDNAGTATKYGLYNQMTDDGTGNRYGLSNIIYSSSGTSLHYGLRNYNYVYASSTSMAQYNYLYCYEGSGTRYGLYNILNCGASCGAGSKYALYSSIGSSCGGYAGYFSGDVYVSGTITSTSDAAKKTNINDFSGALSLITQLKPKTYNYKADADLALPTEKQYGFLAQDLEQVLPELVKQIETLGQGAPDKEGNPVPVVTGEIKTVNYIALIPILVQGMQEQQKTIEEQQKRIDALEAKSGR